MSMPQEDVQGPEQDTDSDEPVVADSESEDLGLSEGFLKSITNPLHAPIVGQYVKQWDGEVTKRFQKIREDTKWAKDYEDFHKNGLTPDQIRNMHGFMSQSPVEIYNWLSQQDAIKQHLAQQQAQQQPVQPPVQQPPVDLYEWEGKAELEALKAQLARTEQVSNIIAQHTLQQEQARQFAQEDAAWDTRLNELNSKYSLGDQGLDFVNLYASKGVDEEMAAKKWVSMVQEIRNQTLSASQAPPVLSGATPPVTPQVRLGDIPTRDINKLVSQFLENSRNA